MQPYMSSRPSNHVFLLERQAPATMQAAPCTTCRPLLSWGSSLLRTQTETQRGRSHSTVGRAVGSHSRFSLFSGSWARSGALHFRRGQGQGQPAILVSPAGLYAESRFGGQGWEGLTLSHLR